MGAFGAFGKMPSLGDFFHFGLPPGFVTAWDLWLQARIAAARERLGEDWQPRYFAAPIWRFTLAPGLAGADGMLGVLMPSVDRVGRHFPLTLAAGHPAARAPAHLHFTAEGTFAALEEVALATLDGRIGVAVLERELAAIRLPTAPAPGGLRQRQGRLTLVCARGEVAACAAADLLAARCRTPSLWSCLGASDDRLLVVDGLPGAEEALGLIDPAAPLWTAETAA